MKKDNSIIVDINDNLKIVKKKDKFGIIDKNGVIILPIIYNFIDIGNIIREGIGKIMLNKKESIININKEKEKMLSPFFDNIFYISLFSKEYFIIKNKNKYGILNNCGDITTPLKYDFIYHLLVFNRVLFVCFLNNKKGIIDPYDREIVPIKYDNLIFHDRSGLVEVKKNDEEYLITKNKIEVRKKDILKFLSIKEEDGFYYFIIFLTNNFYTLPELKYFEPNKLYRVKKDKYYPINLNLLNNYKTTFPVYSFFDSILPYYFLVPINDKIDMNLEIGRIIPKYFLIKPTPIRDKILVDNYLIKLESFFFC